MPAGYGQQPTEIQKQVKELLEAGYDPTTISRRTKVGKSTIYRMKRMLRAHGTNYTPEDKIKKNGRPKLLTPGQELEMKEWLQDSKNRTRYLDDLVWFIHDRFGLVCSTTTMSKIKRKWLRVIEYEETGNPIDDLTRSQLIETHPDLPLLHESQAPATESTSEDQGPAPEAEVAALMNATSESDSYQEQATAGSQQSSTSVPQQVQQHPQDSFLQSPTTQMAQASPPHQQASPTPQQNSTAQQQTSPAQQHMLPSQPAIQSQQQHISPQMSQQTPSHSPQYSPLQEQLSPTQQQLNTTLQAFLQSPSQQMQMQAQMAVGTVHLATQLPHDFHSDFAGDTSAQHLPA